MVPWRHGTMAPWFHGTMVTWYHGVEMGQISALMLRGRFWFESQDFGVSVGAIGIIFRDTSFPIIPRTQNRPFRKIVPGVQGRRNGRGKICFHFWGPNPSRVAKNVAKPNLARESRFGGIRWGDRHHFSRSICSDWSRHPKSTFSKIQSPKWLVLRTGLTPPA